MKKFFMTLAVAAMALGAMTSCGSKAETEGKDEGKELKTKIENCTDPDSLKIYVEQAHEYAAKLEAEGKGAEAEGYLDELLPVVQQKDSAAASYFQQLKSKAVEEVNEAKEAAKEAKDSVASAGKHAVEAGKDAVNAGKDAVKGAAESAEKKVSDAAAEAKQKGTEAVDAAKQKGSEAVNSAKQKGADAVQKGADAVKGLLK